MVVAGGKVDLKIKPFLHNKRVVDFSVIFFFFCISFNAIYFAGMRLCMPTYGARASANSKTTAHRRATTKAHPGCSQTECRQ